MKFIKDTRIPAKHPLSKGKSQLISSLQAPRPLSYHSIHTRLSSHSRQSNHSKHSIHTKHSDLTHHSNLTSHSNHSHQSLQTSQSHKFQTSLQLRDVVHPLQESSSQKQTMKKMSSSDNTHSINYPSVNSSTEITPTEITPTEITPAEYNPSVRNWNCFPPYRPVLNYKAQPIGNYTLALINLVQDLKKVEFQVWSDAHQQQVWENNSPSPEWIENQVLQAYKLSQDSTSSAFTNKVWNNLKNKFLYYHIGDEKCVVINDAFPKSSYHVLVVPRDTSLLSLESLDQSHIPLLKYMLSLASEMIQVWRERDGIQQPFRCGFHAVPSLKLLHMHVISQDFISDRLKNKKHWNSFNTEFFVDAEVAIETLENEGKISFQQDKYEALLKLPLMCDELKFTTIPKLKEYLKQRTFT